jgi:hypothetical protein
MIMAIKMASTMVQIMEILMVKIKKVILMAIFLILLI